MKALVLQRVMETGTVVLDWMDEGFDLPVDMTEKFYRQRLFSMRVRDEH